MRTCIAVQQVGLLWTISIKSLSIQMYQIYLTFNICFMFTGFSIKLTVRNEDIDTPNRNKEHTQKAVSKSYTKANHG